MENCPTFGMIWSWGPGWFPDLQKELNWDIGDHTPISKNHGIFAAFLYPTFILIHLRKLFLNLFFGEFLEVPAAFGGVVFTCKKIRRCFYTPTNASLGFVWNISGPPFGGGNVWAVAKDFRSTGWSLICLSFFFPLTLPAPENNPLSRRFLLETIIFRGELLVLGRVNLATSVGEDSEEMFYEVIQDAYNIC